MRVKDTATALFLAAVAGYWIESVSLGADVKPAPAATYVVKIEFDQRVKMRDGLELSADVYRPEGKERFPVILSRTPYNKSAGGKDALDRVRYFVTRGYVVVVMDVRGRGDSDGKFTPWRDEGPDGYDAIEWCAHQPWSDGKVGTFGGSYLGYNQWMAAVEQPPHLQAMVALVTPGT